MDRYLEIWNLSKIYPSPRGPAVIVEDFRLDLNEGEFVSIIGHSGCGKSTVLSIVAGLTPASSGAVVLARKEIDEPGPDRGVVFQSPCLLPWMSALDNVMLGIDQVQSETPRSHRLQIAMHYLELVGLGDAVHKMPAELSQGMRQRVGIARAFALNPKVLLLDEPFGMLDSLTRIELQQVLLDVWSKDRKTALMVTHDVDEALLLSNRIALMTSGPAATIGRMVQVPFDHPRHRDAVMDDPRYDGLRAELIDFLEAEAHPTTNPVAPSPAANVN